MALAWGRDAATDARAVRYPRLRVFAALWLCVYVPAYATTYGGWHFLYFCNLGILATAFGLLFGNQWLLSTPALIAPPIALLWILDAGWRLATGHFLHGGTAYLWDASIPALTRALSLYHPLWPFLLAYCLRQHGYDRRAPALQLAIVVAGLLLGLYVAPAADNIDYLYRWPGAATDTAQPLVHAVELLGVLLVVFVWPMHLLCRRLFAPVFPDRTMRPAIAVQGAE